MTALIEYIDVYKSFDAPVLRGVNLTVERGEVLAIVGPSGTGKSVLLKMAIGLITPDEGDVLLDGHSIVGASRDVFMRHHVGYVFQNAALFDSMTIFENVAQGIEERELARLPLTETTRRVHEALEAVSLDARAVVQKLPSELSGGMRKRVGLARALVGSPKVLLFDEPVTGLDPVTSASVTKLIAKAARGVTAVLVTHDVEGALDIVSRIALLNDGRMVFAGTPEEFRTSRDPLVRAFADREAAKRATVEPA